LKRGTSPPRWPRTEHASDGAVYEVRPIHPDDAQRERDFIAKLSPRSRFQRFQHDLREPDARLIEQFVNVDQHRTMALVAVVRSFGRERIIGVARYAADSDEECEFAVVVADEWQGRGVGTTLIPLLFEHAASEGFQVIYGMVLYDNERMMDLAKWLGLRVDPPRAGESLARAWRRLR
jgi:acetyltransferase